MPASKPSFFLRNAFQACLLGVLGVAATAARAEEDGQAYTAPEETARLLALAETDYSREIESLRAEYAARFAPEKVNISTVDPDKALLLRALGYSFHDAAKELLQDQVKDKKALGNYGLVEDIGKRAVGTQFQFVHGQDDERAVVAAHTETYPTTSLMNPLVRKPKGGHDCYVIPASYGAYTFPVRGWTPEESARFANRHEFWHCLGLTILPAPPPRRTMLPDAPGMAVLIAYEAFSDAGALSDMIAKDGKPASSIIDIARARLEAGSINHLTVPVLQALEAHIARIGIEAFRELSDKDREGLCFYFTRQHSLTTAEIRPLQSGDDWPRVNYLRLRNQKEKELNALADLYVLYQTDPFRQFFVDSARVDAETAQQVRSWDARAALRHETDVMEGGMTPENLTRAATNLLNAYRKAGAKEPASLLLPALRAKVRTAFREEMDSLYGAAPLEGPAAP